MELGASTVCKPPANCSARELSDFAQILAAGNEVEQGGLAGRVSSAYRLAFLRDGQRLIGITAIKKPAHAYRARVSRGAGVALPEDSVPFEIGWVVVAPQARGRGYASVLVMAALRDCGAAGMFATSRVDNVPMHRTLKKFGFQAQGADFASGRGPYGLRLFLRTSISASGGLGA